MEIVVAALFLLFGLVFAWGSYSLGSGWSDDGPQSGYFPFYINVIIVIASAVTLCRRCAARRHGLPMPLSPAGNCGKSWRC